MIKIKKGSMTVVLPAFNEEKYMAKTCNMITEILKDLFKDYEVIIFDDCSSDKTPQIADSLAEKDPKIRVVHNKKNMGLGYNFRTGAEQAKKEYYCCMMTDIDTPPEEIKTILSQAGDTDFITTYIPKDNRPLYRRIISRGFITTLNFLFNQNMKSYCNLVVYKTSCLKEVKMRTNSFAMNAEVILQLAKKGRSCKQVPYSLTHGGRTEKSAVLKWKNIKGVIKIVAILFYELNIKPVIKH